MSAPGALVRYDAMCQAIALAYAVDEVKDIRDKALALEMYARQANDRDLERQVTEIRIRAERKCGQLLTEMAKAKGAREPGTNRGTTPSGDPGASRPLADMGISYDQSSQWQKLAGVPAAEFETDITDPMWRPTTSGIIDRHEVRERGPLPTPVSDEDALWLWGMLQQFVERKAVQTREPDDLLANMMEHMQQTTRRLAPVVSAWLGRIK